ncbi:hypothetical protein BVIR_2405 [Blastochloris viridis]|uniref:TMAO reductase sytem sensor TorS n=2 Tax=Blastochloris viridis TaxID=1079 RepID=A0A0H5BCG1_BLAVI|nr:hypothetical protein BVIR_2405 [Blastochloris viridis]BAR99897.1 hypothetical protein BV133_2304 [Blastochloris viridis]CUU42836.1 TMAO reductase sytem sensor TorS [Blastochloris viridis]
MKLILSAHVLVVDHDPQTRHETAEALRALGIQRVTEAGRVEDAEAVFTAGRVDVAVVTAERADAVRSADQPRQFPPAPGPDFCVPSILLLATPVRADIRAANAAGYDAVVALPLMARTLYRRIGSLMQRARRHERARVPAGYAGGPVTLDMAAEAKE